MRIVLPGYQVLELPQEIIAPEQRPFNGTTSYASKLVTRLKQKSYREVKLPSKLNCLEVLKERMWELGGYKSYFEPLAGVGLSAALFQPKTSWLNDLDEGCRKILLANFFGTVTGEDALDMTYPLSDLIFMDFNDFTFKRFLKGTYAEALARAFDNSRRFVILNDCSIWYFRYGQEAYANYSRIFDEPITSCTGYFEAVRKYHKERFGWNLIHTAFFRESSFQLFYKGESNPLVSMIVPPVPQLKISEGLLS